MSATKPNAYEGRSRWWYRAISDWMLANPGGKMYECAEYLRRHPNTISQITNTDSFKAYHDQRMVEWRRTHDHALIAGAINTASLATELILESMGKKRISIPFRDLVEIQKSAVAMLGFDKPAPPQVVVNNQVAVSGISADELAEARQMIRDAEHNRRRLAHSPVLELTSEEVEPESTEMSHDVSVAS